MGLCLQLLVALAKSVFLNPESRGTHVHILLSHFRDSPNLEGQVHVFISPRNRVSRLYPQAVASLCVVFYESQGCGGDIRTLFHTGHNWRFTAVFLYSADTNRAVNTTI
jgi:hypothetical protein